MTEHKVEIIFRPEDNREDLTETLTFEDEAIARVFAAHKAAMSNVESARYIEPDGTSHTAPPTPDAINKYAPPHRRTRLLSKIHGGR